MPKSSYASADIDIEPGEHREPVELEPDPPFRILLMGDFSGRANRGETGSKGKPVLVEGFEEILEKIAPVLRLGPIPLEFTDIDDFHPDKLYEKVEGFRRFRQLRDKLKNKATFAEAAAVVKSWSGEEKPRAQAAAKPDVAGLASGNLLDNVLQATETTAAKAPPPRDELRAFIAESIKPYLAPKDEPELPHLLKQADEMSSALMRAVLHHPEFQSLEAAWRALYFVLRRVETDTELKIYVLDISKTEVAEDLHKPATSVLYQALVKSSKTIGSEPWALIAGNYTFSRAKKDIELLDALGKLAKAANAPFLAEGDPQKAPDEESEALWNKLRHSQEAQWIGLALPRFLLRLPYGENTSSVEAFNFEEMPGKPVHTEYLWGNPAFACVTLIAQAFNRSGWDSRPGQIQNLGGMPLHVYEDDGESVATPCAEILMTEKEAEALIKQGFMPLASMKHQDVVRLVRFQSIAQPKARLAGPWRVPDEVV